ncbi:hypothetical protein TruAng_005051 [Truncatella angustata]|nr:hypothetical protein TruAng_005051 [Truncatella angustata]
MVLVSMASTTSPSPVPSSPVRFETPTPDLRPQPLRLSQGKQKTATHPRAYEKSPHASFLVHTEQDNDDEIHGTTATMPVPGGLTNQLRSQSARLGSLVSKFEVLDAVNNADAESSRIPRLSRSKQGLGSPVAPVKTPPTLAPATRRALQQSTPASKSSAIDSSSEPSSKHAEHARPTARRSQLPTSTRVKSSTTGNIGEPPQTPSARQSPRSLPIETETMSGSLSAGTTVSPSKASGWDPRLVMGRKKGLDNEEYSPFRPPKSLLDPTAFRVQQPSMLLNSSSRRLPQSNSSKTIPAITTRSVQRERPSVADLRKSFEKGSAVPPASEIADTPAAFTRKSTCFQHPALLENPLIGGLQSGITGDNTRADKTADFSDVNHIDASRRSKDFGTQTHLSFPSQLCTTRKGAFQEVSEPVHRDSKVGDLRKLFDRFKHVEDSEPTTSITSTPVSQSTPPALTTTISTDDFTCDFKNDFSVTLKPAVTVTHDSPLKDRINRFEQLKDEPVQPIPKSYDGRHPVRNVWRRISQSLTQSFEGNHTEEYYTASYRESSTSMDHSRSPLYRTVFPLLPARKSFPLMQRFSSGGVAPHIFGLDGANNSTIHIPDADVFSDNGVARPSSRPGKGNSNEASHHGSPSSDANRGTVPPSKKLLKQAATQERAARREEERRQKQQRREERQGRIAQRLHRIQTGSRPNASSLKDTPKDKDRVWDKQTASGFMVRQTKLDSGEVLQPKPQRPGQVKKVVNFYKETSTSMLRLVSGGHYGGSKETSKEGSKETLDGDNEVRNTFEQKKSSWRGKSKGKEKARPFTPNNG